MLCPDPAHHAGAHPIQKSFTRAPSEPWFNSAAHVPHRACVEPPMLARSSASLNSSVISHILSCRLAPAFNPPADPCSPQRIESMGTPPFPQSMFLSRIGSECVYAESRFIGMARVLAVRLDESRLEFDLLNLHLPGCTISEAQWRAGCTWRDLRASPTEWCGSPWMPWIVDFTSAARERLESAVRTHAALEEPLRYRVLRAEVFPSEILG